MRVIMTKKFYLILILISIYPTFIAALVFCQIIKFKKKKLKKKIAIHFYI